MYSWARYHAKLWLAFILTAAITAGCGGNPFLASSIQIQPSGAGSAAGGGTTPSPGGGGTTVGASTREIRVTVRNFTRDEVNYHMHFIAFAGPGATVSDDEELEYLRFGYLDTGTDIFPLGSYIVQAPSPDQRVLWFYHQAGPYPGATIGPAVGTPLVASVDGRFDQVGERVPVPDRIVFFDLGPAASECSWTSFEFRDPSTGATQGSFGPMQTQDTGCNCRGLPRPEQELTSSATPRCNEYQGGSDIIFDFRDPDPAGLAPERLLWQVELQGSLVHPFRF